MHELGIVFNIVERVEEIASEHNVDVVNSVTVEVGEVSTVIPEYLLDCWKWKSNKTKLLKDCQLKIEKIPAITICENCKKTYSTIKYAKICPYCKSDKTYLLQGNEFNIKEIEIVQ